MAWMAFCTKHNQPGSVLCMLQYTYRSMDAKNITLSLQNYLDNETTLNNFIKTPYRRTFTSNVAGSFATIVIALASILGNTAVVTVSFWNDILRDQPGTFLIAFLATIDILTAVLVMFPSAIAVVFDYWPLGWTACKMHASFNYTFACASSCSLALISIERAIAVLYPFKYRTMMTIKFMTGGCFFAVFQSFTIGFSAGLPYWSHFDYSEGVCALKYTDNNDVFIILTSGFVFCFCIPAVTIITCNTLIIVTANKSRKSVRPSSLSRHSNELGERRNIQQNARLNKATKSIMIVTIMYYLCFTPYAVSKQVKVCFGYDVPASVNYLSTVFIFISSSVNPFIYGILRKDYRRAFAKLPSKVSELYETYVSS